MDNIENKLNEILERIMNIELRLLQIEKKIRTHHREPYIIKSPPNPFPFPPFI